MLSLLWLLGKRLDASLLLLSCLPHAADTALSEYLCFLNPDLSFLSASLLVYDLVTLVTKSPVIKCSSAPVSQSRYQPLTPQSSLARGQAYVELQLQVCLPTLFFYLFHQSRRAVWLGGQRILERQVQVLFFGLMYQSRREVWLGGKCIDPAEHSCSGARVYGSCSRRCTFRRHSSTCFIIPAEQFGSKVSICGSCSCRSALLLPFLDLVFFDSAELFGTEASAPSM